MKIQSIKCVKNPILELLHKKEPYLIVIKIKCSEQEYDNLSPKLLQDLIK
jgi:hypothetical protein